MGIGFTSRGCRAVFVAHARQGHQGDQMNARKPAWWTPGDWNALFGFGTNILVNLLVLTGLLRFVLKMPDALVFGRIIPAPGLMMALSTLYYAWLAYPLPQRTRPTA